MCKGTEHGYTGNSLLTGKRKGNLYVLTDEPQAHFSYRFKSGTTDIWHQHLGHPQLSSVDFIKNKGLIEVVGSPKTDHLCDSCQLGKLSKLPLSLPKHSSSNIFDKIHCDLWGSIGKFRF